MHDIFELPAGLALDVSWKGGTVLLPYVVRAHRGPGRAPDHRGAARGTLRLTLRVNVVTIFPEFFDAPLGLSIPSRAAAAGAVTYRVVDLRDFTHDRHRTVDDAPYGGGAGMVMKPEPFFEAVETLGARAPIVLMSARGRQFTQADAVRFAAGEELTLLCGHYKDVDQRVADHLATEETLARRLRAERRRAGGARDHRRHRATAPRRDVRPRQRAHGFVRWRAGKG